MPASRHKGSIFSQKLDRVAFTAYFLGAVVPLVALGVVVERYVLPTLADRLAVLGMLGVVGSIGVLSLVAYFVLRTTTRHSIERMDADNRHLGALLKTARALTTAQDGHDAAGTAARCALELTGAEATFVLLRPEPGGEPQVFESAGARASKLAQALAVPLVEMAGLVMSEGTPLMRGADEKPARGSGPHITAALVAPLCGDEGSLGAVAALHVDRRKRFDAAQLDSFSTLAAQVAVSLHNADLRHAQRNFFSHVTEILVSALDSHLDYHSGHGNRVAQLANRVGRELGLPDDVMQRLHFSALLHDIGLLKFDRSVHKNTKACQKHTVIGARMLARIRLWQQLAPIVQHHHEWFDGNGYPEGLAGESIPLESRIIAVCDAFDTITSDTSYKMSIPFSDAVAEIENHSGTQFDPTVVRAFRSLVDRGVIDADSLSA